MVNKSNYIKIGLLVITTVFIFNASRFIKNSTFYQRKASNEETGMFLKNLDTVAETEIEESILAASVKSRKRKTNTPLVTQPVNGTDNLKTNQTIEETGTMTSSSSAVWWLNSGGRFDIKNGIGSTIKGDLPSTDKWFKEYLSSNKEDTDNGLHPQNIFRLVQRGNWQDFSQQVYLKISKINESESENRNASNGVLLFNRYQSGDNLYYAGLRVDGGVVIKKKYNGKYYTLAYKKIFNQETYNINSNPNLIPLNLWIGIKTELKNLPDGTVSVKLFVDQDRTGNWVESLNVIDKPGTNGSGVIFGGGYAGIRSDFMDVEFKDYLIESI